MLKVPKLGGGGRVSPKWEALLCPQLNRTINLCIIAFADRRLLFLFSDTNTVAEGTEFSNNVRLMDQKFTMFVPSNEAWEKIRLEYVTSHKSLFEGRATYQVRFEH